MAGAELNILIKAKDQASQQLSKIQKNIGDLGGAFQKAGLGMMAVGGAVAGGFVLMGKSAADFDNAMREVNTMMNLSEEQFSELGQQVQDVSKEVGKSSVELSGALYQIVSAGVDASDAIAVLGVASKAAVAGVTDVETAADGLTTVLNAFKIPAKDANKVADIMFTTVKRGKTTFDQLSKALYAVSPMAATAGIKFEEVAAAIATVTKQGVPTTVATTQLRAAIQAMIKPTEDMSTAINALGYESGQAMIAENGMAGSMVLLAKQAGGSLENLGKMFGSIEGLGAVMALTGENSKVFAEDLKATSEDAAGAVDAAYKTMNEGVSRQFEITMNKIKLQGEAIGATLLPIFSEILKDLQPIIDKFAIWVEKNEALIPQLLKVSAAIIGVGGILFAIGSLAKMVIALNAALIIFHSLSGPAGWVMLGVAAALAAGTIIGINQLMPTVPSMASGGVVTRPTLAMIGERGPEAVVPLRGGMGMNVTVNVEGSIISDRDLASLIRAELLDIQDRNYSTGLT